MRILLFIVLTLVLWVNGSLLFSYTAVATEYPQKISIAIVEDPIIEKTFKPILINAYARLGIKTEYIMLNMARSTKLLQTGNIDAELLRMSNYLEVTNNSSMIKVNVPIVSYGIYLICSKDVNCKVSELNNKKLVIGVAIGDRQGQEIIKNTKQQAYTVNSRQQLIGMLHKKHIDYAVAYIADSADITFLDGLNYVKKPLLKDKAYHFINKRYAFLLNALEKSLAESLTIMPPRKSSTYQIID